MRVGGDMPPWAGHTLPGGRLLSALKGGAFSAEGRFCSLALGLW